jgi:hypothetical protein
MPSAVETLVNPHTPWNARAEMEPRMGEDARSDAYDPSLAELGEIEADAGSSPVGHVEVNSKKTNVKGATPENGEPIPGYLSLSVPEILNYVRTLDTAELGQVVAFEKAHRNRKTLLIKLGRMTRPSKTRGEQTLPASVTNG